MDIRRIVTKAEESHDYLHLNKSYPSLEKKWYPILEEGGYDLSKIPRKNLRLMAAQMEVQEAWNHFVASNGSFSQHFGFTAQADHNQEIVSVQEAPVTTSDIAAFTTQSIAWVASLYEKFDWLDVVTVRQMLGPRAYIHSRTDTREDASDFYAAGSALNEGIDPSFTECPEECVDSSRVGVEIDSELLEAECRSVAAEYCIPANFHVRDQYGRNLETMLDEAMIHALQRDIQAEGLDRIRSGAGGTLTYAVVAPAGSYYATANPNEYKRVLWETVRTADMQIRSDTDSFRGASIVLGDPNFWEILLDLIPLDIRMDTRDAGNGPGQADEMSNFFGTARNGRYRTYLFSNMPEDTGIVMGKDDNDPTFIWAPWIPITDIGTLVYPKPRRVEKGMITLHGQRMLRPGRVREIQLV